MKQVKELEMLMEQKSALQQKELDDAKQNVGVLQEQAKAEAQVVKQLAQQLAEERDRFKREFEEANQCVQEAQSSRKESEDTKQRINLLEEKCDHLKRQAEEAEQ